MAKRHRFVYSESNYDFFPGKRIIKKEKIDNKMIALFILNYYLPFFAIIKQCAIIANNSGNHYGLRIFSNKMKFKIGWNSKY